MSCCRDVHYQVCQFCKGVIHGCRETAIHYGAKQYHLDCWDKLRLVALRTGGQL